MFDMIDVIQMSRISKHYLLEYQTLLDSYEMQAPNVTSGFRVLDFSDDISDVDYTSDDWSFNESYSETSGEMTNSMQAKLLSNPPEYSVCAGSKPLSIIIRRCNTPTVVCSSPVQKVKEGSSCATGNSLSPVHCAVDGLYICPERAVPFDSDVSEKGTKLNVCEYTENVNLSNKNIESQERTKGKFNGHSEIKLIKDPTERFPNVSQEVESSETNGTSYLQNQIENSICDDKASILTVGLLSSVEEDHREDVSDEVSAVRDCCVENRSATKIETINIDSHLPISENLDTSELSCFMVSNNSSSNLESRAFNVPKPLSPSKEVHDALSECNSLSINNINFDAKQRKGSISAAEEVNLSTISFFGECSNLVTDGNYVIEHCSGTQSVTCPTEDSTLPPLEDLNSWRHLSCSPLLFSSDDESSSFTEEVNRGIEAALAPSPQLDPLVENEKRRVGKLQELLMGAPPPPTVTMPLFSASEILQTLKDKAPWATTVTVESSRSNFTAPWTQEALVTAWPHVKHLGYPGIHYNHGTVSEQFEGLCQKLLVRCVGSETASSVTVWSSFTLPAPRRERRMLPTRRGPGAPTGLSPGRRLSHLARRHRTFSSAALLADGARLHSALPHAIPERRTILVEGKKKESCRKPRSSQKKRGGGAGGAAASQSGVAGAGGAAASQSGVAAASQGAGSGAGAGADDEARDAAKLRSSKRALFQSPNDDEKKAAATALSKFRPSSASAVRSRRALFADQPSSSSTCSAAAAVASSSSRTSSGRKRAREDSDEDMCQRLPRRKLFGDDGGPTARRPTNISTVHKKKLLWAVAEALKTRGFGLTHPRFRACASILGAKCRVQAAEMLTEREGSTSDRLLELTLRFVDEAIAQHEALLKSKHNGCNEVG